MVERTFLLYFLILPISIGAGIFLTGLVLLWIDSRREKQFNKIEIYEWEEAGGKILSSRLEQCPQNKVDSDHPTRIFQPVVEYIYTVDGKEITGNTVFPGDCENFTEENAQALLDKYTVNSYVPVRYKKEDPSISALEEQPSRSNKLRMFGLLFTWFGVSVCCFSSLMIFIMSANII